MWEGVGDRTELQHIDPNSIGHKRVSFPFSWAAQPGACGPSLSGTCSSIQHLLSNCNCSIGGLRAHSAGCWLSLPHLVSDSFKLPVHRVTLLFYAHSISSHNWPKEYATSAVFGMSCFDHHRVEITVMQFTGHLLPVHQFVTVPRDFNPIPYCQPGSPTQSLPITGQRNMQLPTSSEWHVWSGRRSIYNTHTLKILCFWQSLTQIWHQIKKIEEDSRASWFPERTFPYFTAKMLVSMNRPKSPLSTVAAHQWIRK